MPGTTPYGEYLNGMPMIALIASGIGGLLAFMLLCSSWSAVKTTIVRYFPNDPENVTKCKVATQQVRYVKVFTALVLCIALVVSLIYVDSAQWDYGIYYGLPLARSQSPMFGWFLTACSFVPWLVASLALAMIFRVRATPALFRKRMIFVRPRSKGRYMLVDLDHPRYEFPPSDISHRR